MSIDTEDVGLLGNVYLHLALAHCMLGDGLAEGYGGKAVDLLEQLLHAGRTGEAVEQARRALVAIDAFGPAELLPATAAGVELRLATRKGEGAPPSLLPGGRLALRSAAGRSPPGNTAVVASAAGWPSNRMTWPPGEGPDPCA